MQWKHFIQHTDKINTIIIDRQLINIEMNSGMIKCLHDYSLVPITAGN